MPYLDISLDLEQLIQSETLPAKTRDYAQKLYDQLQTPVRILLTGAHAANKIDLLEAMLEQDLPRAPGASLYVHHGANLSASYLYSSGETIVRDTMRAPPHVPESAQLRRIDVTLPSARLQDISLCVPSPAHEQELRASQPGTGLADLADMVLWCTDAFAGVEATQWSAVPDALKDHSFLVYLASARPLLRDRLKRLRAVGQSDFYRLETVDLRRPHETGAPSLLAELLILARRGKSAEVDNIALFVKAHCSHIPHPPPQEHNIESTPSNPAIASAPEPVKNEPLQALYRDALSLVRTQAQNLVNPLPQESDDDTARVLQICAEAAESVAALFEAFEDTDPAYCFVKEEVLSTADRLLLMSMEQGLGPATDAATTLLQMRRDFDFQIAAISGASFTRSQSISPIDQLHA